MSINFYVKVINMTRIHLTPTRNINVKNYFNLEEKQIWYLKLHTNTSSSKI